MRKIIFLLAFLIMAFSPQIVYAQNAIYYGTVEAGLDLAKSSIADSLNQSSRFDSTHVKNGSISGSDLVNPLRVPTYDVFALNATIGDSIKAKSAAFTSYLIANGASIFRGGLALTGSTAKTINFAGMTPAMTDADNSLLSYGTWNDEVDVGTQTAHFVPFQVHMHSTTSAPYDIAAMRLRVDTDGSNAQNAVQVMQIRSSISDDVASAGAFGAGMSIDAPMIVQTGEMVVGGFSMAGAYKPTSATNPVTILQAANWNTYAGTSVTQIADFYQNGAGNTVDDILRLNVIAGTATDGLHVSNTSGTMTNGIRLTGTIGTDIILQNAETIKNTTNGKVTITGIIEGRGQNSNDSLLVLRGSLGNTVSYVDSTGKFVTAVVLADTMKLSSAILWGVDIGDFTVVSTDSVASAGAASDTTGVRVYWRRYFSWDSVTSPSMKTGIYSTVFVPEGALNPDSLLVNLWFDGTHANADSGAVMIVMKGQSGTIFSTGWITTAAASTWEHRAFVLSTAFTRNEEYEIIVYTKSVSGGRWCWSAPRFK